MEKNSVFVPVDTSEELLRGALGRPPASDLPRTAHGLSQPHNLPVAPGCPLPPLAAPSRPATPCPGRPSWEAGTRRLVGAEGAGSGRAAAAAGVRAGGIPRAGECGASQGESRRHRHHPQIAAPAMSDFDSNPFADPDLNNPFKVRRGGGEGRAACSGHPAAGTGPEGFCWLEASGSRRPPRERGARLRGAGRLGVLSGKAAVLEALGTGVALSRVQVSVFRRPYCSWNNGNCFFQFSPPS